MDGLTEKGKTMDKPCREMTFEEEAKFYEEEARAEFAKETGNTDSAGVNNILRRGMRIIRKARQEIASREVVRCKDCKHRYYNEHYEEYCCEQWADGFDTVVRDEEFCSRGERKDNGI